MLSFLNDLLKKLFILNPIQRKFILLIVDSFLIINANLLSFILISNSEIKFYPVYSQTMIFSFVLGVFIYLTTGQYKGLSRYVGSKFLYYLSVRNFLISIFLLLIFLSIYKDSILIKFTFVFWLVLTSTSGFLRFAIRDILLNLRLATNNNKKRVAIYGVGASYAEIYASLKLTGKYQIKSFIDDNSQLWNRKIYDVPIISPFDLTKFKKDLDLVLIASSFDKKGDFKEFLNLLEKYNLPVMEISTLDEIASGAKIDETLKPIKIEEFLGRDSSITNQKLLIKDFKDFCICITGAGGSIGSELCRQIQKLNPKKIILIENNEANLFNITNQIKNFSNVKSILGSILDEKLLNQIFSEEKVDLIFHAAAYKHVPLVELNIVEGVKNNVIATKILCKAAIKNKVKQVVLISTDKAVRPTNVMGASKRLAEKIIRKYSIEEEKKFSKDNKESSFTKFSMVRFGNVLGSSGSVVPLFQKQIAEGGPITLTDKNIERYFMTIPEAAQLVLRASTMSKGGELFLLDMGKPIKIYYLAEQMIRLNGLKVKNDNYQEGDIEIKITGLRPGEKLFEELLVGGKAQKTSHPLIFKDPDKAFLPKLMWGKIDELDKAIEKRDQDHVKSLLSELVPEWTKK